MSKPAPVLVSLLGKLPDQVSQIWTIRLSMHRVYDAVAIIHQQLCIEGTSEQHCMMTNQNPLVLALVLPVQENYNHVT